MLTAAVTVPVIAVNSGAQYGTQHFYLPTEINGDYAFHKG